MNEKKFTNYIKLLFLFLFSILLYTPAINSENIVRNEVEDPRLTGEEFEGADPNVLTILDLSGSMGRNYGGEQVGDWDGDDVFARCANRGTEIFKRRVENQKMKIIIQLEEIE